MASGGARSGAGRKRKAPALTAAERAAVPAPIAPREPIIPPIHLSTLAQLIFRDIAGLLHDQGRADPWLAQHIALLAQRLEQVQRWQAVLEMVGDTCTSTTVRKVDGQQVVTEMIRARPEVAMLSDAMRQAQSLLGELMLNPSSAMRIATGGKQEPGDFDDF